LKHAIPTARWTLGVACAALLLPACCPLQITDTPLDEVEAAAEEPEPRSLRPTIRRATLPNGLDVYMLEDHAAPLVSFQVWFDVGSRNEREARDGEDHGITGLSHFFEHMMFRGTEKHPKFFDEIYALGGKLNAFTWLDETVYWENMPSQHLERVIDMEADRLEHMAIDFLNLEPEREVVKSERLLRTENRPSGMAWETLQARAFTSHPYHWKTIGWMSDLNAITVAEANDYHRIFYAPNNATILVSGDHDPDQTLKWITQYYGHLESRDLPSDVFEPEPRQEATLRDRVFKSNDPQTVMWGYRAPAPSDLDFAVLEIIDRVLTDGKSSRLQKQLVYATEPRLSRLYAYLLPIRDPYLYIWGAILQPGMTTHALEAAIDAEVQNLANDGITKAELARAVAKLRSDVVRENLSNQKKAEFIGFSLRTTDSPFTFFDRLEAYAQVTVEDIKRVASDVLRSTNRTVVPVVAPDRFAALAGDLIAAATGLPAQAATALTEAVAITLERQKHAQTEQTLDVEADAVARLARRAEHARAEADEETKAKIDTYLVENEKGVTKRSERLKAGRDGLAAERKALDKRSRKHARAVKALRRMRWDPSQAPAALVISLVEGLAGGGTRQIASVDTTAMTGAGALPLVVAYETLVAWALEDAGQDATAAAHRASAIALGGPALAGAADDAGGKLLRAAHALAWDTQVTGKGLADAPVAKRSGGRRGR